MRAVASTSAYDSDGSSTERSVSKSTNLLQMYCLWRCASTEPPSKELPTKRATTELKFATLKLLSLHCLPSETRAPSSTARCRQRRARRRFPANVYDAPAQRAELDRLLIALAAAQAEYALDFENGPKPTLGGTCCRRASMFHYIHSKRHKFTACTAHFERNASGAIQDPMLHLGPADDRHGAAFSANCSPNE
jgi:hypothetical protein